MSVPSVTTLFLSVIVSLASSLLSEAKDTRPNIIFFLADDLGWTDINGMEGHDGQIYSNPGGEFDSRYFYTPNLAKLGDQGMRFIQAYASAPFCGPSRASILTGKYPARLGFTNNNTHDQTQGRGPFKLEEMIFTEPVEPDLVRNLDPSKETSIARALKTPLDGLPPYLSCAIGKWHVYSEGTIGMGPDAHGFDYHIGTSHRGAPDGRDRHGWNFYRGAGWSTDWYHRLEDAYLHYKPDWPIGDDEDGNQKDDAFEKLNYLTDALTHRALEFIDLASQQSRPFFLYLSHYGVHSPMQARRIDANQDGNIAPDDPEAHAPIFKARWGRDARHEINPPPGSRDYHTRYTYASMIKSLDESLGSIMDRLEDNGLSENTIICFFSDNGGVEREGFTSNNPLRSEKTHAYEGGTRVPLIVSGPDIPARSVCRIPVIGADFFPTLLELAGISLEAVEQASEIGFSQDLLDGVSLVPLLRNQEKAFHRENDPTTSLDDGALFWHVPHYKHSAPYSAVLKNNYKFIRYWEDQANLQNRVEGEDGYFMSEKELFHLTNNLAESGDENLNKTDSTLVKSMEEVLRGWLQNVDAKMPTAVKRVNKDGVVQAWYSHWLTMNDPNLIYENPIIEAQTHSNPEDTIIVYPLSPK